MENLLESYFLNIIVNANFFNDLKFKYYCECYPEILLQELKLMEAARTYFLKKLLDHEILRSLVSMATDLFFEKAVIISAPPLLPTYLLFAPLLLLKDMHVANYEDDTTSYLYGKNIESVIK